MGNWKVVQYGKNLEERKREIEYSDFAAIIWVDNISTIARNLELLKSRRKTLYGYSSKTGVARAGELSPKKAYDSFYSMPSALRHPFFSFKSCFSHGPSKPFNLDTLSNDPYFQLRLV